MSNDKTITPNDINQDPDVTCRISLDETEQENTCLLSPDGNASPKNKRSDAKSSHTQTTLGTVVSFIHHRVLKSAKKSIGDQTVFGNTTNVGAALTIDGELPEAGNMPELGKQYEVLRRFAEGGQGILSTAQDKILKRVVALKSLRPELLDNPAVRQSFLNEAMITAQLEHPAIVTVYSLLKDDKEGIHLTMKLVRGKTLKEILHEDVIQLEHQKMDCWDYAEIMRRHIEVFLRFCDAVDYAHSRDVIHCDLKPENLMVGEYGEAYVMDWGIAKNLNTLKNAPKDAKQPMDGTPRYMAPEILCGKTRDTRADIYALGLILYEIVTLQHPFEATSIKETIQEVRNGNRKPVENPFGLAISPSLAAIIDKASAYAPEERYQTVRELAMDLRRYLADEPIEALPDTKWMKLRRFISHHSKAMLTIALIGWFAAFLMSALSLHQARLQASTLEDANTFLAFNYKVFNMQGNVIQTSIRLSNSLVDVERRLCGTMDYATMLADSNYVPGNRQTLPILDYREYAKHEGPAFGPRESLVYYGKNIPTGILSYVVPVGANPEKYLPQLEQMAPISKSLETLVLLSDGPLRDGETMDDRKNEMLDFGLLIRRAYVGLDSTGLQIAYPFNPEYSDAYDNRKREWYVVTKEAFEKNGKQAPVWGKPYQDAGNGRPLLACTYALLDKEGNFIGVAGADIHFEKLVQYMKINGNTIQDGVVEKFLVNRDGTTLARIDMRSSIPADVDSLLNVHFPLKKNVFDFIMEGEKKPVQVLPVSTQEELEAEEQLRLFVRDTHKGDCGWMETKEGRDTYLYLFSFLPNSNLFIVEKCDKSLLLASLSVKIEALERFQNQLNQ